jgi:hypothetical protein
MIAALSLTNIYPGFSPGNKAHKYYFGVWTLSGFGLQTRAHIQRAGWETYLSPPLGSVLL